MPSTTAVPSFPFALALALAPLGASAQIEPRGAPPEELVVTASRTEVPASRVGSSLTVIDRATLEARQVTLVSDALRAVPGLAVSRGGGLGAVTQVRMRGTEGNHALVLIDGIEANNPVSNSEFDFANLLVADVERVEILRGPQSALYGSDAVGGVINVITRQHPAGLDASLRAERGSFRTREVGLEVGGGGDRYTGGFSLTRLATDGENIARGGDENDGFTNESMTLHGRAAVTELLTLRGNLRYIDSHQDFDRQDFSFPPTPTEGLVVDDDVSGNLKQWFLRLEAVANGAHAAHRLGVSETHTRNTFFDGALPTGWNEGNKTKLDYQYTLPLGAPRAEPSVGRWLTLALERELTDYENRGPSPVAPENQKRSDEQTGAVAEFRAAWDRADFSASARFDDNASFDDALTYRLTGSVALGAQSRLHSSLGTGVANPGFFELFGFFPDSFVGNPALVPEHSTSFDVGIERRFARDRWRFDLTYFRADLEDEIQTTFDFATFRSSVTNLSGDSERRGAELGLNGAVTPRWQLAASYTYTDSTQPDGLPELRRARHIASLDNTFRFANGRARLHAGIDYNGEQIDNEFVSATPETRIALSSYTLVNVAGDFAVSPRWRIYARAENLLDEEYEEWFSYRGRGRAIVAGFELALR